MSSPVSKPNWLARLSVVGITLLSAGCQDYAARRDTIAFHAGESVAYNRAVHTIDPWPAASARTDFEADGARAVRAIERYESGGAVTAPPPTMSVTVPMPAGAAPR